MRYQFGPFILDTATRELKRHESLVHIEPQVYGLLIYFVANSNRVISKVELIDHVWNGRTVADSTISSRIKSLRAALGDDGTNQVYLKTVRKMGFRFTVDVEEYSDETPIETGDLPAKDSFQTSVKRSILYPAIAVFSSLFLLLVAQNDRAPNMATELDAVRIAILPIVNDTDDDTYDWTETGLMSLLSRDISRFTGHEIVDINSMVALSENLGSGKTDKEPLNEKLVHALQEIEGATHIVSGLLSQSETGDLRLVYRLNGPFGATDLGVVTSPTPIEISETLAIKLKTKFPQDNSSQCDCALESIDDPLARELLAKAENHLANGELAEATKLVQAALEKEPESSTLQIAAARILRINGDLNEAERRLLATKAKLEATKELAGLYWAHRELGYVYDRHANRNKAIAEFQKTIEIAKELGSDELLKKALLSAGQQHTYLAETDKAARLLNEAEILVEESQTPREDPELQKYLGNLYLKDRQNAAARKAYTRSLEGYQLAGDRLSESIALSNLSRVESHFGNFQLAKKFCLEALNIRQELNDPYRLMLSYRLLAGLEFSLGNAEQLKQAAKQIEHYSLALNNSEYVFRAKLFATRSYELAGQWDLALQELRAAMAFAQSENLQNHRLYTFGKVIEQVFIARSGEAADEAKVLEILDWASENDDELLEISATIALANFAVFEHDYQGAKEILEPLYAELRYGKTDSLYVDIVAELGLIALLQDDLSTAKNYLIEGKRHNDFYAKILLLDGLVETRSSRPEEGLKTLERARQVAGGHWIEYELLFGDIIPKHSKRAAYQK